MTHSIIGIASGNTTPAQKKAFFEQEERQAKSEIEEGLEHLKMALQRRTEGLGEIKSWAEQINEANNEIMLGRQRLIFAKRNKIMPDFGLYKRNASKGKGWKSESARHSLAAKKIKTGRKKRQLPNITKQMREGICMGCGGTGYIIKMPEKKKIICRLCRGRGYD